MRTRSLVLGLVLAGGAALAGCMTSGMGGESNRAEYNRLNDACKARGGIFTPSTTTPTGRTETDYTCVIRGTNGMTVRN